MPGLHVVPDVAEAGEEDVDLAAEDRGGRRPAALVGHVQHLRTRRAGEELRGEVVGAAVPGRRVLDRIRLRLRGGDELVDVAHRHRRVGNQHVGHVSRERDGLEVVDPLERHVGHEEGIHRVRRHRADEDRVAVGRRLGDLVRPDVAGGARLVLDHRRLAPALGHLHRDQPREHVGRPARGPRHDQPDDLRWIGLRQRRRRDGGEHEHRRDTHDPPHVPSPGDRTILAASVPPAAAFHRRCTHHHCSGWRRIRRSSAAL